MAEPVVETRTISGRGKIRIDEKFDDCRLITLYSSVLRMPKNRYLNKNWSPDQGQYANLTFCYQEYVDLSFAQKYENQSWTVHNNESAQLGASLVCVYDGILERFSTLASLIPAQLFDRINDIRQHPYSSFRYDELRFDCYADTALTITLIGEKISKCSPDDAPNRPPQLPPVSFPQLPPGTPLSEETTPLSPPYEEDEPDKEKPFPGDEVAPPPPNEFPAGQECVPITLRWIGEDSEGVQSNIDRVVYGVVEGQRVVGSPGNYSIFITCQGDANGDCIPVQELEFFSFTGAFIEFFGVVS